MGWSPKEEDEQDEIMAVMPAQLQLFDEILEFLASAPTAQDIIAFKAPDALDQRLHDLLDKNADTGLTVEERTKLDEFLRMNRFMMRLKVKARKRLMETE